MDDVISIWKPVSLTLDLFSLSAVGFPLSSISRTNMSTQRLMEHQNVLAPIETHQKCVDTHLSHTSFLHSASCCQNAASVWGLCCSSPCLVLRRGGPLQRVFFFPSLEVFWRWHRLPEHGKLKYRTCNFFACHGGSLSGRRYAQRDLLIGGC